MSSRKPVDPDPYPSGIYSMLSYPSLTPAAAAPATPDRPATPDPPAPAVLARIGDVDVTETALCTPAGEVRFADAVVEVADLQEVRTPAWAMICAVLGFFVVPVFSLLFLLAGETVPTGAVRVTISGGDVRHETVTVDPDEIELARTLAAT